MDDTIQLMIESALKALKHAYSPYSKFSVACCLQSENGGLYTGVNVENASYGLTLCAEMSAVSQMISSGDRIIEQLVILSSDNTICAPCGSCRQVIQEFSKENTLIKLCDKTSVLKSLTIHELLPLAFHLNH